MNEYLEAIEKVVRRKLDELEMKIDSFQGCLDLTQDKFTRFGIQNQDRIDKELGTQQAKLMEIAKRMTEIEIELGMATPLKRLETRHWMQQITYNAPTIETELKEEEI